MKRTILALAFSVTAALGGDDIARDYIHDYYNGNQRVEDEQLRRLLVKFLDEDHESAVVIIVDPNGQIIIKPTE